MARVLSSFLLLLSAAYYTTALHPDLQNSQQQPLVSSFAPVENQPLVWGIQDRSNGPGPVTCTSGQAKLFVRNSGPRQVISTLLTFAVPLHKYCWLEFVAPAGAKEDFRVTVRLLQAPLTCPSPGRPEWEPNEAGYLKVSTKGGNATWEDRIQRQLNYPMGSLCADLARYEGVELIPQEGKGDINLAWRHGDRAGLKLMVSN
jgi:hypothetical protein